MPEACLPAGQLGLCGWQVAGTAPRPVTQGQGRPSKGRLRVGARQHAPLAIHAGRHEAAAPGERHRPGAPCSVQQPLAAAPRTSQGSCMHRDGPAHRVPDQHGGRRAGGRTAGRLLGPLRLLLRGSLGGRSGLYTAAAALLNTDIAGAAAASAGAGAAAKHGPPDGDHIGCQRGSRQVSLVASHAQAVAAKVRSHHPVPARPTGQARAEPAQRRCRHWRSQAGRQAAHAHTRGWPCTPAMRPTSGS